MFLCRRLPRQVSIAKHVSATSRFKKFPSSIIQVSENAYNVYTTASTAINSPPVSSTPSSSLPSSSFRKHPWFRFHVTKGPVGSNHSEDGLALSEYMKTRRGNPDRVKHVYTDSFDKLVDHAIQSKMPEALDALSQDLLEFFPGRKDLIRKILSSGDYSLLKGPQVLALLRAVGAPLGLSRSQLIHLTSRISYLKPSDVENDLTCTILPLLLQHLKDTPSVSSGADSVTHSVPAEIFAAFDLLYKLVKLGNRKGAWVLFQLLVEKLYIPPEAVQKSPAALQDFAYIMSITLARSCIHWQRRGLGHLIVSDLLSSHLPKGESNLPSHPDIVMELGELVSDTLYAFLNEPTRRDFESCVDLICQAHSISPVQNGLIRLAYNCALQFNYGSIARRLYAFTRSPEVVEKYDYPAPSSKVLLWLLKLLTRDQGSTQLARMLAEEVVDSGIPLPVHDRAEFIAITAQHGFAMPARSLWQRYSVGRDHHAVVGSSKLMLRMVKLFTLLGRRIDAQIFARQQREQAHQLLDDQMLKERYDDMSAFASHVLSSFITYHEPLEGIQHHNLTSLARAYFVMGEFEKGFQMFRVLLDRKEIPDLYDINAALSALAEYSPRTAARLIERMAEKGLQPDEVTIGTVVHQALLADDMELVGDLISRAKELGVARLSPQTIVSLIRASVTDDADTIGSNPRTRLREAMKVVKLLRRVGMVSSPHIGKYLVYASLRQREPLLAYGFWDLLLRRSAEWMDREQVFIRRLIRRRLQTLQGSLRRGGGKQAVTERMLSELDSRPAARDLK